MEKNELYTCPECGLSYNKKDLAKRCEDWCKKHKSCNLEITKQAVNKKELFKKTNDTVTDGVSIHH